MKMNSPWWVHRKTEIQEQMYNMGHYIHVSTMTYLHMSHILDAKELGMSYRKFKIWLKRSRGVD